MQVLHTDFEDGWADMKIEVDGISYAAEVGVEDLWAVGELSKLTAEGFGPNSKSFDSMQELISACKAAANNDVVFLVKGSRGAHMEDVV